MQLALVDGKNHILLFMYEGFQVHSLRKMMNASEYYMYDRLTSPSTQRPCDQASLVFLDMKANISSSQSTRVTRPDRNTETIFRSPIPICYTAGLQVFTFYRTMKRFCTLSVRGKEK
ncbi:hypothetical protein RRG08_025775 [Elysia crispata]|uniref:Uncharacterized protein n=1 Tax=Elysia crispata TaxID=231223 RepID=A0AAE1DYB8_9GAST|nr:hypothetical protein RRG08_025775 [Elysia crispata]